MGLWNLDGRPVEVSWLAAIGSRQSHRGSDGGYWIKGPIGLGCQMVRTPPQPAQPTFPLVHPAGFVVVFDGRLDNREDLLSSLRAPGLFADSPDAAFVLGAYERHGERFVEHLNGDFALGLFDPRRQRLFLARDAIGIKPLHYCRCRDAFVFASEIKSLLAHPQVAAVPNHDALAGFLLRGYQYGTEGRTFFEDVFSVSPAHLVVVTRERLTTRQYWDFDTSRQVRFVGFNQYADAFADEFTRAVRRRLRISPAAVSVSGGLDSSSILCVALQASRAGDAVHAPIGMSQMAPEGSAADERGFLLEIERDHGIAIDRIWDGGSGVMDHAREEVWHVEAPILGALSNRHHAFMRAARRRGVRVLIGGHWGDQILCGRSYLVDLARRFEWTMVRSHLRELPRWYADVERPGFTRAFVRELLRDCSPGVAVALAKRILNTSRRPRTGGPAYTAAFAQKGRVVSSRQGLRRRRRGTAHAESIYAEVRSGYHVLCMETNDKTAAMYGLDVAFPFLDRDLVSFLMAIPGEMLAWNGVPKALLREGLRAVVPRAILARRGKADFTDLLNEGMECDLPQVAECLQAPGLAVALGYVDGDATVDRLERLEGRMKGPDGRSAWGLQEILSLELWLQVFFEASLGNKPPEGSALNHARPH
ncbi:MAG: asparagine synthase-related protein [Acidobacteriota bacterium]